MFNNRRTELSETSCLIMMNVLNEPANPTDGLKMLMNKKRSCGAIR